MMALPTVRLLVISTCPQCKALREMLSELGVDYQATDIDTLEEEARTRLLADMAPHNPKKAFPVIFIDNKAIIGFQKETILNELGFAK